jgi:hypothetical protein
VTRNPMPAGRRDEVLSRDNWTCQARRFDPLIPRDCAGRLVVHHRRPKGVGGSGLSVHDVDNLVTLCDSHHRFVHEWPYRSYDSGLLVRRSA